MSLCIKNLKERMLQRALKSLLLRLQQEILKKRCFVILFYNNYNYNYWQLDIRLYFIHYLCFQEVKTIWGNILLAEIYMNIYISNGNHIFKQLSMKYSSCFYFFFRYARYCTVTSYCFFSWKGNAVKLMVIYMFSLQFVTILIIIQT